MFKMAHYFAETSKCDIEIKKCQLLVPFIAMNEPDGNVITLKKLHFYINLSLKVLPSTTPPPPSIPRLSAH